LDLFWRFHHIYISPCDLLQHSISNEVCKANS
jgi:hypothetical protein